MIPLDSFADLYGVQAAARERQKILGKYYERINLLESLLGASRDTNRREFDDLHPRNIGILLWEISNCK